MIKQALQYVGTFRSPKMVVSAITFYDQTGKELFTVRESEVGDIAVCATSGYYINGNAALIPAAVSDTIATLLTKIMNVTFVPEWFPLFSKEGKASGPYKLTTRVFYVEKNRVPWIEKSEYQAAKPSTVTVLPSESELPDEEEYPAVKTTNKSLLAIIAAVAVSLFNS